jgi:hypothetical protein
MKIEKLMKIKICISLLISFTTVLSICSFSNVNAQLQDLPPGAEKCVSYPDYPDDSKVVIHSPHSFGECGGYGFYDILGLFSRNGYKIVSTESDGAGGLLTMLEKTISGEKSETTQPDTSQDETISQGNPQSKSRVDKLSTDSRQLPPTLSIKRPGYDFIVPIPLVAILDQGNMTLLNEKYPEKSTLLLTTYNPLFEFQFRDGSKVPLVNIKQILLGQVRPYGNSSEALNSTYMFKDIGFNQKTILPLKHDGFNYMVIEVQFANNMTGVYAFAFESTPDDSNAPAYVQSIREQSKQQGLTFINSSSSNVDSNEPFLEVSRSVMCHITLSYGFQICSES